MRRVEFLLALPKGPSRAEAITRVDAPASISRSFPSLWTSPQTGVLQRGRGELVLGHVFSRACFQPAGAEEVFTRCHPGLESRAQNLIDRFWGAYLFVSRDLGSGVWAVMPDPSGLLPVYRFVQDDMILLASDPALFELCTHAPLGVSYSALRAHLLRPELRQRQTCLENVDELTPATLSSTLTDRTDIPLWHAPDFARRVSPRSFAEHAEELRHLSTNVVGSWTGHFGCATIATSGGVDSSLICAAASVSGSRFGCVSLATMDPSGDERLYARAVAEACGVPFAERLYDPALFDPSRSASAGMPRPGRRAFLAVLDQVLVDAMTDMGAEVVLDGNGGDNIFCFLHSSAPLVDRLRAEGLGPGTWETLLDMCRITGCSISTMLRATLRRLAARTNAVWPLDDSLLSARQDPTETAALTPWLPDDGQNRSGWQDHLLLIMHAQNHIHGATTALQRFSPLASQPIVEFCLAAPTWHWTRGGRNRALARAAFDDILPPDVLARTSKAGPDSFTRAAFVRNQAAITERLLDGNLAAAGVTDRAAVEQALQSDPFSNTAPVGRLLDLLEAENWVRSWRR